MHDPLLVGRGQALRDLDGVVHGLAGGKRARAQALAQRHAVEQLEHDVGVAFVLARVEDRDEVGVVEGAGGLRLLLEAAEPIGIGRGFRGQHLDRHFPPEPLVARAVDLPHPARAQRSQHLVGAQTRAGRRGRIASGRSGRRPSPA